MASYSQNSAIDEGIHFMCKGDSILSYLKDKADSTRVGTDDLTFYHGTFMEIPNGRAVVLTDENAVDCIGILWNWNEQTAEKVNELVKTLQQRRPKDRKFFPVAKKVVYDDRVCVELDFKKIRAPKRTWKF